jgi:hypothetical protein
MCGRQSPPPPVLLACAPDALVLADAPAPALLASAPDTLVRTDAPPHFLHVLLFRVCVQLPPPPLLAVRRKVLRSQELPAAREKGHAPRGEDKCFGSTARNWVSGASGSSSPSSSSEAGSISNV